MKRLKVIVFALSVLASALSLFVAVNALDGCVTCVSSDSMWRYCITEDGTVCIYSGIQDMECYLGNEADVTVPSVIDSHKIDCIEKYAFNNCNFIQSVTISEGIKAIKNHAFFNCTSVKRIVLPESLELIEEYALPENTDVTYMVVSGSYAEEYISSHGLKFTSVAEVTGDEWFSGWRSVDNKKYYYDSEGKMVKSALKTIGGKKYYFGKDGAMYKSRLISVNCKKYYLGPDGAAYTKRLISLDGKKYYLGPDGIAYTKRLISLNGIKYYLGWDGVAYKSRLISVSGKKYYIGSDCKAYKNKFASLDGKKYYFGSDSVMRTGWRNIKDGNGVYHKYYFGADGIMKTGWQKIKLSDGNTYKYYFKSNGIMVTGKVSIDGKTQYFMNNGRYVEPGSPLLRKVYVYRTGKKYHYKQNCCGTNCTQITLLEAKEKGLTACNNCV